MPQESYTLKPIGKVISKNGAFILELDPAFRQGMLALEGFSHVQVFCWFHLFDKDEYRSMTVTKKPYKKGPAEMGIFATRSPVRPNPIALTTVPVLGIDHDAGRIVPFIVAAFVTFCVSPVYARIDQRSASGGASHRTGSGIGRRESAGTPGRGRRGPRPRPRQPCTGW